MLIKKKFCKDKLDTLLRQYPYHAQTKRADYGLYILGQDSPAIHQTEVSLCYLNYCY